MNPAIRMIFTVSPIPLFATFEGHSAILADCASKSALRAAIEEVMMEKDEDELLIYWPSFESFRWLGVHAGPVFGADDGSTMHASEFVIDAVFKEFYEKFNIPEGGVVELSE